MPPARIELATFALQVQRSTTKLKGHSYRKCDKNMQRMHIIEEG